MGLPRNCFPRTGCRWSVPKGQARVPHGLPLYKILELLMKNPGKIFSAENIYTSVWNEDGYAVENTVMVHIRHLREKIEINPKEPRYIKVVWGLGYKIEEVKG